MERDKIFNKIYSLVKEEKILKAKNLVNKHFSFSTFRLFNTYMVKKDNKKLYRFMADFMEKDFMEKEGRW